MTSSPSTDETGAATGMEVYEDLRRRAQAAIHRGHFEAALQLYDSAWEVAKSGDDLVLADRAFVNRSSVHISLYGGAEVLSSLQEILVRNLDPVNCRLAAYNIARIYEVRKETKKGLFYARIAGTWTDSIESPDPDWVASSHNQVGNFLVAESRFNEAIAAYEQALAAAPDAPERRRALVWDNLGYCLLVKGAYAQGFELIYRALRVLRRQGAEHELMLAHLDLAFGHLEVGRYPIAQQHAAHALALAERYSNADVLKNALYLSGEAANVSGDIAAAREHFERLQRYFPNTPFVTDFLLAIDVRKMINLRA